MNHSKDNEPNARQKDHLDTDQSNDKYKEALDMSIDENDKALQDRFAEMRNTALAHIPSTKAHGRNLLMLWPALGALSAALVLAVVMLLPEQTSVTEEYVLDDLDMLLETEDLEMLAGYELEFYVWLEQVEEEQG